MRSSLIYRAPKRGTAIALLAVSMALVFPLAISAAEGPRATGVLSGLVEDSGGVPIPGAKVKLIQKTSTDPFKATSDESGHFEFMNLPEGEYVLSAQAPGFEKADKNVKIGSSPMPSVHLRLDIAEKKEEVTVTADDLSLPSAQNNVDSVEFGHDLLDGLPAKDDDRLAIPSLFVNPAAAGTGGVKVLVDGVETDAPDLPASSIRHVRVNKNPYSAEFSRPGKARIEVTTKHQFHRKYHGSLSALFHNSALDARNAFATERPLQQRVASEAELDGPIIPGSSRLTFLLAGKYDSNNQGRVVRAETLDGPLVENVMAPEHNAYLFSRLNFRINPIHKLSATYKFKDKYWQNQGIGGTAGASNLLGGAINFNLPERATDLFDHGNELKIFETSTPTPEIQNEFRLTIRRRGQDSSAITNQPAIIVLGAFSSGGAQIDRRQKDTLTFFEDAATLAKTKHTLRFGAGVRPRFIWAEDASNFGGTFSFSSLSAFSQNSPFLFTQNAGNPVVSFAQHETYAFVQDEMRLRPNFSLMLGLRHEWQSNGNSLENFAPRLALAYSPHGGQIVLRAGFGVFYERQPEIIEQQSLLQDGVRIRKTVISDPPFPIPFSPVTPVIAAMPSVERIAPGIGFPYLMQGGIALERKLGSGQNYLSAEYMILRGVHLYRMRNINAPGPGTPGSTVRPNSNFVNIDQFESSGTSRSNSLTLTLQTRAHKRLNFLTQYTFSRIMDDTEGPSSLPANNYDLRPEWGRTDFDRHHQLNLVGTYAWLRGLKLGAVLSAHSGPPFNITTGFDDNDDTVANDRLPGVHRNSGQGPAFVEVDLRLSKGVRFEKRNGVQQAEFSVDVFNLVNTVNFVNFVGTQTSPLYGQANAAYAARKVQLSMRFSF